MARRVPTSPDRHISSSMPPCPLPAMAQCRDYENETTLYWHQAVDILIQELEDYGDHWFSILGKRQEASHHSSSTRDANGLFKMLPQSSPGAILFSPLQNLWNIPKSPDPFIWHVCIQQPGLDVSAVSSVLYTASAWSVTGTLQVWTLI